MVRMAGGAVGMAYILSSMTRNGQTVHTPDDGSKSLSECDPADLLLALKRVRIEEEHGEVLRHGLVSELRGRSMPWAVIAEVSGINERTLRRHYSKDFTFGDYLEVAP
jgi:hypothetical protein